MDRSRFDERGGLHPPSHYRPFIFKCRTWRCNHWHVMWNHQIMILPFSNRQEALAYVCGILQGEATYD